MPDRSHQQRQMALPLPDGAPIYTRGAYVVSDSNAAAWRAAEAWARSGAPAFIICGPAGSGKTHLASILAQDLGGQFCDLAATEAPPPGDGAIVFDNLPGNAPHKLFAFIEDLAARRRRLVLAGAGRPGEWSGGLKDLRTRLEAMPRANLGEPDETLIRCVIAKGFRDRQVAVAPEVVNFVALRLQRKFAAARAFVVAADRAALEEKRKISIAFAQEIIDNLLQREPGVGGEDTAQPRSDEGGAIAVSR